MYRLIVSIWCLFNISSPCILTPHSSGKSLQIDKKKNQNISWCCTNIECWSSFFFLLVFVVPVRRGRRRLYSWWCRLRRWSRRLIVVVVVVVKICMRVINSILSLNVISVVSIRVSVIVLSRRWWWRNWNIVPVGKNIYI